MKGKGFLYSLLFLLNVTSGFAQMREDHDPAKAESIIRDAIKARGGDAYLNVRTSVSRGQFTPFDKGMPTVPTPFIDYIAYPDRERTEFGKGDTKFIQTNSGAGGWIYEAKQKMIRDQTEDQVKRFQQGAYHDVENLLRRAWQEPGAKLVYLGRREAWINTFSDAVRIDFQNGASVILHFDSRTKLPLMTEYKTIGENGTTNDQTRYFRWVEFQGVKVPTIVDFYSEVRQTARINVDTFELNVNLPEKLFAKPANVKEIK